MMLKKRLAREIMTQLYSQKDITEAEEHFIKVFQKGEVPEEIKLGTKAHGSLQDYLVENRLAKSRSEAKRLIEQGAVDVDGKRVTDVHWKIIKGNIIKVGKRRFIEST